MTIRHLKIFIAVAECGSMNTAAKELFLSQPTISQAIRELEEYYGTRLFDRLSRRLHITPAGQELLNHAYPLVSQFDQLEHHMLEGSKKDISNTGISLEYALFIPDTVLYIGSSG